MRERGKGGCLRLVLEPVKSQDLPKRRIPEVVESHGNPVVFDGTVERMHLPHVSLQLPPAAARRRGLFWDTNSFPPRAGN